MSVVVVGLNHRTVPLEILERVTVSEARLPKALHDLTSRDEITEAIVLSTCNRTEVYADVDRFHAGYGAIRDFLAELGLLAPEDFSDHLYVLHDDSAVRHLFTVAAGLDSAVLGEGEILGQVRDAWEKARAEAAAGPILGRLFRHAVEVGKRARTETAIARGTTSVSQAAVAMAEQHLGTLRGRRVLVLGAGEMGEGIAVALAAAVGDAGARSVAVANRTLSKARALAARVGGEAVELASLPDQLLAVDVVLACTGSPDPLLTADDLAPICATREGRHLLLVDVAVPRDIDPAVATVDEVTLLDMDDLRAFADRGRGGRSAEVALVEAIVAEEVERFEATSTAVSVAPLVAALRERVEELRASELDRVRGRLADLDDKQREAVEAVTRGVLGKLLHEPTVRLKHTAGTARGDRLAEALRELFDL